ncbi:MAG: hypothetical protein KKA19_01165, partial [Candidatus Margulisbacteria bacterium]|nr:hypothetical protein [Candidatus Margulisiibacteriota bacterium]
QLVPVDTGGNPIRPAILSFFESFKKNILGLDKINYSIEKPLSFLPRIESPLLRSIVILELFRQDMVPEQLALKTFEENYVFMSYQIQKGILLPYAYHIMLLNLSKLLNYHKIEEVLELYNLQDPDDYSNFYGHEEEIILQELTDPISQQKHIADIKAKRFYQYLLLTTNDWYSINWPRNSQVKIDSLLMLCPPPPRPLSHPENVEAVKKLFDQYKIDLEKPLDNLEQALAITNDPTHTDPVQIKAYYKKIADLIKPFILVRDIIYSVTGDMLDLPNPTLNSAEHQWGALKNNIGLINKMLELTGKLTKERKEKFENTFNTYLPRLQAQNILSKVRFCEDDQKIHTGYLEMLIRMEELYRYELFTNENLKAFQDLRADFVLTTSLQAWPDLAKTKAMPRLYDLTYFQGRDLFLREKEILILLDNLKSFYKLANTTVLKNKNVYYQKKTGLLLKRLQSFLSNGQLTDLLQPGNTFSEDLRLLRLLVERPVVKRDKEGVPSIVPDPTRTMSSDLENDILPIRKAANLALAEYGRFINLDAATLNAQRILLNTSFYRAQLIEVYKKIEKYNSVVRISDRTILDRIQSLYNQTEITEEELKAILEERVKIATNQTDKLIEDCLNTNNISQVPLILNQLKYIGYLFDNEPLTPPTDLLKFVEQLSEFFQKQARLGKCNVLFFKPFLENIKNKLVEDLGRRYADLKAKLFENMDVFDPVKWADFSRKKMILDKTFCDIKTIYGVTSPAYTDGTALDPIYYEELKSEDVQLFSTIFMQLGNRQKAIEIRSEFESKWVAMRFYSIYKKTALFANDPEWDELRQFFQIKSGMTVTRDLITELMQKREAIFNTIFQEKLNNFLKNPTQQNLLQLKIQFKIFFVTSKYIDPIMKATNLRELFLAMFLAILEADRRKFCTRGFRGYFINNICTILQKDLQARNEEISAAVLQSGCLRLLDWPFHQYTKAALLKNNTDPIFFKYKDIYGVDLKFSANMSENEMAAENNLAIITSLYKDFRLSRRASARADLVKLREDMASLIMISMHHKTQNLSEPEVVEFRQKIETQPMSDHKFTAVNVNAMRVVRNEVFKSIVLKHTDQIFSKQTCPEIQAGLNDYLKYIELYNRYTLPTSLPNLPEAYKFINTKLGELNQAGLYTEPILNTLKKDLDQKLKENAPKSFKRLADTIASYTIAFDSFTIRINVASWKATAGNTLEILKLLYDIPVPDIHSFTPENIEEKVGGLISGILTRTKQLDFSTKDLVDLQIQLENSMVPFQLMSLYQKLLPFASYPEIKALIDELSSISDFSTSVYQSFLRKREAVFMEIFRKEAKAILNLSNPQQMKTSFDALIEKIKIFSPDLGNLSSYKNLKDFQEKVMEIFKKRPIVTISFTNFLCMELEDLLRERLARDCEDLVKVYESYNALTYNSHNIENQINNLQQALAPLNALLDFTQGISILRGPLTAGNIEAILGDCYKNIEALLSKGENISGDILSRISLAFASYKWMSMYYKLLPAQRFPSIRAFMIEMEANNTVTIGLVEKYSKKRFTIFQQIMLENLKKMIDDEQIVDSQQALVDLNDISVIYKEDGKALDGKNLPDFHSKIISILNKLPQDMVSPAAVKDLGGLLRTKIQNAYKNYVEQYLKELDSLDISKAMLQEFQRLQIAISKLSAKSAVIFDKALPALTADIKQVEESLAVSIEALIRDYLRNGYTKEVNSAALIQQLQEHNTIYQLNIFSLIQKMKASGLFSNDELQSIFDLSPATQPKAAYQTAREKREILVGERLLQELKIILTTSGATRDAAVDKLNKLMQVLLTTANTLPANTTLSNVITEVNSVLTNSKNIKLISQNMYDNLITEINKLVIQSKEQLVSEFKNILNSALQNDNPLSLAKAITIHDFLLKNLEQWHQVILPKWGQLFDLSKFTLTEMEWLIGGYVTIVAERLLEPVKQADFQKEISATVDRLKTISLYAKAAQLKASMPVLEPIVQNIEAGYPENVLYTELDAERDQIAINLLREATMRALNSNTLQEYNSARDDISKAIKLFTLQVLSFGILDFRCLSPYLNQSQIENLSKLLKECAKERFAAFKEKVLENIKRLIEAEQLTDAQQILAELNAIPFIYRNNGQVLTGQNLPDYHNKLISQLHGAHPDLIPPAALQELDLSIRLMISEQYIYYFKSYLDILDSFDPAKPRLAEYKRLKELINKLNIKIGIILDKALPSLGEDIKQYEEIMLPSQKALIQDYLKNTYTAVVDTADLENKLTEHSTLYLLALYSLYEKYRASEIFSADELQPLLELINTTQPKADYQNALEKREKYFEERLLKELENIINSSGQRRVNAINTLNKLFTVMLNNPGSISTNASLSNTIEVVRNVLNQSKNIGFLSESAFNRINSTINLFIQQNKSQFAAEFKEIINNSLLGFNRLTPNVAKSIYQALINKIIAWHNVMEANLGTFFDLNACNLSEMEWLLDSYVKTVVQKLLPEDQQTTFVGEVSMAVGKLKAISLYAKAAAVASISSDLSLLVKRIERNYPAELVYADLEPKRDSLAVELLKKGMKQFINSETPSAFAIAKSFIGRASRLLSSAQNPNGVLDINYLTPYLDSSQLAEISTFIESEKRPILIKKIKLLLETFDFTGNFKDDIKKVRALTPQNKFRELLLKQDLWWQMVIGVDLKFVKMEPPGYFDSYSGTFHTYDGYDMQRYYQEGFPNFELNPEKYQGQLIQYISQVTALVTDPAVKVELNRLTEQSALQLSILSMYRKLAWVKNIIPVELREDYLKLLKKISDAYATQPLTEDGYQNLAQGRLSFLNNCEQYYFSKLLNIHFNN